MRNDDADAWPIDKDGFRLRGANVTRLEAFTDAAFAFAITLLVISIDNVPTTYEEMLGVLTGVPAFAFAFAMICMFWLGHWQWSRRFGYEDGVSITLTAMLIFTVLVYVYPLKYMSSIFVYWITGGRLGAGDFSVENLEQLHGIFLVYGIGFVSMSLLLVALNLYALRNRQTLLDSVEMLLTRAEITVWSILAAIGLISTLLAAVAPPTVLVLPGWCYMLIPVAMGIVMPRFSRRHASLIAERAAGSGTGVEERTGSARGGEAAGA